MGDKPNCMQGIVRQECSKHKVRAMPPAPECCRPLGKRMRGNDEIGGVRPYDTSHRTPHYPRERTAHKSAARILARNAKEHIVEVWNKAQHQEVDTLHQIVNSGDFTRHKVHHIYLHLRRRRVRCECCADRLCCTRMPGADGCRQNKNADALHSPPPHTVMSILSQFCSVNKKNLRSKPAIDTVDTPRHPRCRRRGEKCNDSSNFLGAPDAPHRIVRRHLAQLLRTRQEG